MDVATAAPAYETSSESDDRHTPRNRRDAVQKKKKNRRQGKDELESPQSSDADSSEPDDEPTKVVDGLPLNQ